MQIKILKTLFYLNKKYEAGKIIEIKDEKGIPIDRFWRNRLEDSKIDDCIEIVKEIKQKKEGK